MATCVSCSMNIEDDVFSYIIMDLGVELYSILLARLLFEVDEDSVLCQLCFDSILRDFQNGETVHPQITVIDTNVCVCCHVSLHGRRSVVLRNPEHAEMLRIHNIQVPLNRARVCYRCWFRLSRSAQRQIPVVTPPPQAVIIVEQCASCHELLFGRRTHILHDGPERNFIAARIHPQLIPDDAYVCVTCWVSTQRNLNLEREIEQQINSPPAVPMQDEVPEPQHEEICLDSVTRVSDTGTTCFVPGCPNPERLLVPKYLKKRLLSHFKVYIPRNARVCQEHKMVYDWEFLNTFEFTNRFSKNHIDDMLHIAQLSSNIQIDFNKIEEMPEHYCQFWIGMNSEKFLNILNQSNINCRSPRLALGVYLIKIRTGEPIRRIASLMRLAPGRICKLLKLARDALLTSFVPRHLGLPHLSREQLIEKSLMLPEGLYGNRGHKAIIICDGTYVYMQKSSNYCFQKKTYSLHKHRTLVKPFLFVATDGHILDVYGPYAATVSDADIMTSLFQNENNPLRNYFEAGDVFILDRGFRDSLSLLRSLGYDVYKPESLALGETQLSTLAANKSRFVTLCRWVIEVVNGRYKRDFKIFRDTYFNLASRHLIIDFKIASAIINAFHPPIQNRPDANQILNRALERFELPNHLGQFVITNNLNRRRAHFRNIDGLHEDLNIFPQMTMSDLILFSLGIYQIKQARSYYGEHIRQHGTFIIEVAEVENTTVPIPDHTNGFLIRGRIKSRHQSRKIYYTYLLLVGGENWTDIIKGYYCSCVSGNRTVGCCAHTMTLVWYLGWARHQQNIEAPASFLDGILVREDVDESDE